MKKKNSGSIWLVLVVVVVAAIGFYFWSKSQRQGLATDVAKSESSTPLASPSEPPIRFPVPKANPDEKSAGSGQEKAVPALDDSDAAVTEEFAKLFGQGQFETLLNLHDIIRHLVVTIDNLSTRMLPQQFSPAQPPEGDFTAKHEGENRTLSDENAKRYQPYVTLFDHLDSRKVVAFYIRYYRLFQAAYTDLGLRGYFNDRLVDAIDKLLSTPTPDGPILLLGEDPFYKFADPKLESLQAGQKILIRMGAANERIVKAKLKDLRLNLVSAE